MGEERDLGPGLPEAVEGAHRDGDVVAHAAHVDHRLLGVLAEKPAAELGDHEGTTGSGVDAGQAQGDRQGVGGVAGLAGPGHLQDAGDHEGHLLLVGPPEAGDLLLHRGRGELVDRQAGLGAGQEDDAADVAENEGGAGVGGVEDVLDGEEVGAETPDHRGDTGVDVAEALGQGGSAGRGDGALLHQAVASAVGVDGPVAGADGAGIDAEDEHPFGGLAGRRRLQVLGSEMSEFSQTFWTSSWSSRASSSLSICWALEPSRAVLLSAIFLTSASSGSMPAFTTASRTASKSAGRCRP